MDISFSSDILIVGCGLSGAVIAREMAEHGKKVLVWDRRNHIGGNMYDFYDEDGILVQQYGPHAFHTDKKELYDYIQKFSQWDDYKLYCGAQIDGKYTPTPFNFQTIDDFFCEKKATEIKEAIKREYGNDVQRTIVELLECNEPLIRKFAQFLFDKDYSLYTAKQWGIPPSEIDISVLKRVPVVFSYDTGYFSDQYQVMPQKSFKTFFDNLLSHENITVELRVDAKEKIKIIDNKLLINNRIFTAPVVYTGAVDELFEYRYGLLPYRSLRFEYKTLHEESFQPEAVVAYPQAEKYTRITEYTKLPIQKTNGITKIAIEYPLQYEPGKDSEPYYPVLTQNSLEQYDKYKKDSKKIKNLVLCGRLADFKYYYMDQALDRALDISKHISFLLSCAKPIS